MRRWWLTGGVWLLCALPCFSRTTMLNDMPDTCRMTVETHPAVSDPELTARYEERYQKFKQIYPTCKPLFKKLAE